MTTFDLKSVVYERDDIDYDFTKEEQKKIEIEYEKYISKEACKGKSINVSLIVFNELEKIGFKNDMSTIVLSKLIEDLYHERKAFDNSDYFDLSKQDNIHYSNLVNSFIVGDEQLYREMVNKSIEDSQCETKDINEIAYALVGIVSKTITNNVKMLA